MREHAAPAGSTLAGAPPLPPLHGLLLSGGRSVRMGRDKALIEVDGEPQLRLAWRVLHAQVAQAFVSLRADQRDEPVRAALPGLVDRAEGIGPAAGLLAAHEAWPDAAWLVLACDLPNVREATLATLVDARDPAHDAVAYASREDGAPEPLCAIWEPVALMRLAAQVRDGRHGLRDALRGVRVRLLPAPNDASLENRNSPVASANADAKVGP